MPCTRHKAWGALGGAKLPLVTIPSPLAHVVGSHRIRAISSTRPRPETLATSLDFHGQHPSYCVFSDYCTVCIEVNLGVPIKCAGRGVGGADSGIIVRALDLRVRALNSSLINPHHPADKVPRPSPRSSRPLLRVHVDVSLRFDDHRRLNHTLPRGNGRWPRIRRAHYPEANNSLNTGPRTTDTHHGPHREDGTVRAV